MTRSWQLVGENLNGVQQSKPWLQLPVVSTRIFWDWNSDDVLVDLATLAEREFIWKKTERTTRWVGERGQTSVNFLIFKCWVFRYGLMEPQTTIHWCRHGPEPVSVFRPQKRKGCVSMAEDCSSLISPTRKPTNSSHSARKNFQAEHKSTKISFDNQNQNEQACLH